MTHKPKYGRWNNWNETMQEHAVAEHWRRDVQVTSSAFDSSDYFSAGAHTSKLQDETSLSVVQLRGLPYRATVEDILGFLGHHASNLCDGDKSVQLVSNHKGRPSGFAKLYFNNPEAAAACRDQLHMSNLEDRYIEVFLCNESQKGMRQKGMGKARQEQNFSHNFESLPMSVPEMQDVQEDPYRDFVSTALTLTPDKDFKEKRIDMDVAHIKKKDKNTFLEFSVKDKDTELESTSRRARSDLTSDRRLLMSPDSSAAKSPQIVSFESPDGDANKDPAYLIPMTPSPLLHPDMPPMSMIPPFGYFGDSMLMGDSALPQSFEEMGLSGPDGSAVPNPYLDFLNPDQFFSGAYCDNFETFASMQNWMAIPEGFQECSIGGSVGSSGGGGGGGGGVVGGGGGGKGEIRPGDWECPGCGANVFASKDKCFKCGGSKRTEISDERDDYKQNRQNVHEALSLGDWECPACAAKVFASKSVCFKCGEKRPRGPTGDDSDARGASHRNHDRQIAKQQQQANKSGQSCLEPGTYTTVMLRNIPNKYTREMLVNVLNMNYKRHFDFVYLPIDFKNKCNVGYGFINFRSTDACERFIKEFDGVDVRQCLPGIKSKKIAEVTPASQQGLAENVRRLRNSPVMNQLMGHPEWMPLLMDENGDEEQFPLPDQQGGKSQREKLWN